MPPKTPLHHLQIVNRQKLKLQEEAVLGLDLWDGQKYTIACWHVVKLLK